MENLLLLILILPWKILFILLLILGSVIAVSAPSWFIAWAGLEINTIAVLAILIDNKSPRNAEAAIKYFLIQALASSLLILRAFFTPSLIFLEDNIRWRMVFIFLRLIAKIGAAPFHFWLPQVIEGLSWANSFITLLWQKIAPFILCTWCLSNPLIRKRLNFFIISSALVGALGGIMQTSLRKILAFSSINHLGWILIALKINFWIWGSYFTIYRIILSFLLIQLSEINLSNLSSNSLSPRKNKISFISNLFSFGGLPPFIGFIPKWVVITFGAQLFGLIILILILSRLLTLFFYLRIIFNALLRKNNSLPLPLHKKREKIHSSVTIFNLIGLILSMNIIFQL